MVVVFDPPNVPVPVVHVRNCPARQQCKLEAYPTLCRLTIEYELRAQVFSSIADADHYGCQFACRGNGLA